ncbi:MEMO1 family protein EYX74_03260 [Candidatus Electrothrix gigas]
MRRQPIVADRFYEGDPGKLYQTLRQLIPKTSDRVEAKAVLSPHAGYVYSGGVAGETFARVTIPETVILLGPNHQGSGMPLAVGSQDWDMPLGQVPLARDLAESLTNASSMFTFDDTAHCFEHSLEVQVPFVQFFQKNLQILPIVIAHLSLQECCQAAHELAQTIHSMIQFFYFDTFSLNCILNHSNLITRQLYIAMMDLLPIDQDLCLPCAFSREPKK